MPMSDFEKQAFLQLLAEQQARQDAEQDAVVETELDAEAAIEEETARQDRLQWAQNQKQRERDGEAI
jgi:hypothetical protein